MQYNGGKARLGKRFATIINAERGDSPVWEPFMGGLWLTHAMGGEVIASDIHPGLANLYNSIRAGSIDLPDDVSPEEYKKARQLPDSDPIKTFIGFGCSWGGKWYGGYAKGTNGPLTYCQLAKRNVLRHVSELPYATFTCANFFDRVPVGGVIGVLDSPYGGTTGYGFKWDASAYAKRVREWVEAGSIMYVCEYNFPFGEVVFERDAKRTQGASNGEKESVTERLYRCAL